MQILFPLIAVASSLMRPAWAKCPDPAQGETEQDCPWAEVARAIHALGPVSSDQIMTELNQRLPLLVKQVRADQAALRVHGLWGRSLNYDEFAKGTIVDWRILGALEKVFGLPETGSPSEEEHADAFARSHPLHAGLEHTYGYLFSVLKTSFGYKRQRWVSGTIERGMGLTPGVLGPKSDQGTLLSNVTYFAGRFAFSDSPSRLKELEALKPSVHPRIRDFRYERFAPIRLEEMSEVATLRTDLVPFEKPEEGASHLLVYSVQELQSGEARGKAKLGSPVLVTAFPVDRKFVEQLCKPESLGENKPIVPRYNAAVPGFAGSSVTGTRKLSGKI